MYEKVALNLHSVLKKLPSSVKLVAVSKYHSREAIEKAYEAGQRAFGESHVQELSKKVKVLPEDIEWHFIGHLQTNKVKYIAPYISMIDAVDSFKLLKEINKQGLKNNRIINVLLELHIAEENTKYGFSLDECWSFLEKGEWRSCENVRICGLMMIASNVDDVNQIQNEMQTASEFFYKVKKMFFQNSDFFKEKSWGMSEDYQIALKTGATMVRIGSYIFGQRIC